MAKRKRKHHQSKTRQHSANLALGSGSGLRQQPKKPQIGVPNQEDQTNSSRETQNTQLEWVKIEYRDADGNPTLPLKLIASTYNRRYSEVPTGSEIKVHVLAGYKPNALMMVERKIYEIQQLLVRGWRRSGQVVVEVDGGRHHEGDWFKAILHAQLQISDPGLSGPHNVESDYIVSQSSFDRKIVMVLDEKGNETKVSLYEGTLKIKETWKSAWRRQGTEVLNLGLKLLFIPLLVALGAGLTLLWVDRYEPSNQDVNYYPPEVPPRQTANDKPELSNFVPKDPTAVRGSSDYEDEQFRQIPAMDSREKKHTLELLRPIKIKPGQL